MSQLTLSQLSINCRPSVDWDVDQVSTERQPSINQDVNQALIDHVPMEGINQQSNVDAFSTHDPN